MHVFTRLLKRAWAYQVGRGYHLKDQLGYEFLFHFIAWLNRARDPMQSYYVDAWLILALMPWNAPDGWLREFGLTRNDLWCGSLMLRDDEKRALASFLPKVTALLEIRWRHFGATSRLAFVNWRRRRHSR